MPKYRKKPIVVKAEQWFPGKEVEGVIDRAMLSEIWFGTKAEDGRYFIRTLEGEMNVMPGDYIITRIRGEKYPCKKDIFE